MSEKTRAELKEQIKIMNHNYQVIREMHEKGYQYSIGEIKRLQDELERTRKALDVAKERLKNTILDAEILATPEYLASRAKETLEQITALEQKD